MGCKRLFIAVALLVLLLTLIVAAVLTRHPLGMRFVNTGGNQPGRWLVASIDVPIVQATVVGDAARVRDLISTGANVNAVMQDSDNKNPPYSMRIIHYAAAAGDYKVLNALIDAHADANCDDENLQTPLMKLAELESADIDTLSACVDALIRGCADLDASDNKGDTALHHAVLRGNVRYAALLLEHGANVNVQNKNGTTPLCVACFWYPKAKYKGLPELLVHHGADMSAHNPDGSTCADVLTQNGFSDVAKKLERCQRTIQTKQHGAK